MRSRLALLILFIFFSRVTFAQEEEANFEELLLEQLGDDLGENIDVSELLERLEYYRKYPLDLNKATALDLNDFVFLTSQQIENILFHRTYSGDFISLLELQAIPGLDLNTIQFLQNFVKVGSLSLKGLKLNDVWREHDGMFMLRYGRQIEQARGYSITDESRSRYLGDANRYAIRYRMNYQNRIKIALNAEKDAGEPFFKEKQKLGFDFYGGHLEINDVSTTIRKIVLGDYALQFGQGLVLWNGLSFGKGAWIGAVARQGMGLRGYSSMNENNFQRGVSALLKVNKLDIIPFIALNNLSGNVIDSENGKEIETINYSGLHRTPTELKYRDEVKQLVYGANATYAYHRLKFGMTYLGMRFNGTVRKGEELRQQFDFEGRGLQQLGLHYQYNYRNYFLFGETALNASDAGGIATNNGIIASLHPKLSIFGNYRNYQRNYHNFYGQSLAETSGLSNEKGVYSGIVYHVTRKIEWSNYLDFFQFPWLRYHADAPSKGLDFLSQFTYSWYKVGKLTLRYRSRIREENLGLPDKHENYLSEVLRNQYRIDFQYKLNDYWSIRSRFEYAMYSKQLDKSSGGYLVYQDAFWKSMANKLNLSIRLAYFDTDDYESRIYAYENDVLYASSFPMYYDKGIRTYLNARIKIANKCDLWGRYALTKYASRESIGSGLDEIEGNVRSDVKIQLRWQW